MTRLLLTSTGLKNPSIQKRCSELLRSEPREALVLFVPTARECSLADSFRVERTKESFTQLTEMGVKRGHILTYDSKDPLNGNEIKDVDAVFVSGGFTYYLLQRLRRTHFDKALVNLVNRGVLYIGESAGSILPGPDISIAGLREKEHFGLKNTVGLKLTKLIVFPHFKDEDEERVRGFEADNGATVARVTDSQAILEIDGKPEIIG
jgi:dipeptidase E